MMDSFMMATDFMMGSNEEYVEDQKIVLPDIVDGPTAIGDLWDCQKSKLSGFNLFGKQLDSQHLQANVIKKSTYTLTHVRSTTDRHKLLQVSGEVALEILGGLIKAGGGAEYESDEQSYISEEELLCHYDLATFSVNVLPSAQDVMDPLVKDKLLRGEIKATHVVASTILGAKVMASIIIRETKQTSKEDIKGNFFGTLKKGPMSASAKLALTKLDDNKSNDFEKKIKVDSKPFFNSQPVTVSAMFEFIEAIGQRVEKEKHHAFINANDSAVIDVFGVPLRFHLVPIKQYLDILVERMYVQIKDVVLESIAEILKMLIDFQIQGHFKKMIFEKEPRLKRVLLDENNPLVVKISQREKEIQTLAKKHYSTSAETLKAYKLGMLDQKDLCRLAKEIDKEINLTSIFDEIQEFIFQGRKELLGIHYSDIDDSHQLRIFTNEKDMTEWYRTQKLIKVLLRTGSNCINNSHVTRLYDISGLLKNIGVEVGIATPIISDGRHDLSIKVDDSEVTYSEDEISFVIKILLLLVNQAGQASTRLFNIYASQNGIKLPFSRHMKHIQSIINILSEIKQIKITDSYLKMRDLVLKNDGRWKFVMDLNALDSAAETIKKLCYLNVQLSELGGDWIVGSFGFESSFEYSNGPLLFIFKDEKLEGICFDNVDILLLIEAFKPKGDRFFKLLHPDQIILKKSCLLSTRVDFALKVIQLFQVKGNTLKDEPKFSNVQAFSSSINKRIEAMQVLIRSFVLNDNPNLWAAMAEIIMDEFPDVKTIFKTHLWDERVNYYHAGFQNINVNELIDDLMDFLSLQDPFYAKVIVIFKSVSYFATSFKNEPDAVYGSINNLTSDSNCPEQLREQLLSCQEIMDNALRIERVEKILKRHLEIIQRGKYEIVTLFVQLLETTEPHLENFLCTKLLPVLATRLDVDESKYPMFLQTLLTLITTHDYYMLLQVLVQMQYAENRTLLVYNHLDALTSITDTDPLCQLLGKNAVNQLTVDHYQWLFKNPKFILLLETNSSCIKLLQTIKFFHCQKTNIPSYIPMFLRKNLQEMMDGDVMVECPDIIQNIDEAAVLFHRIISQSCVPDCFGKVLGESVTRSLELKTALENANALFYWSEERQLFTETWNYETITDAYNQVIKWKNSLEQHQANKENLREFYVDIIPYPDKQPISQLYSANLENMNKVIGGVNRTQAWKTLLASYSTLINPTNFLKIQSILAEPHIESLVEEGYIGTLIPYVIQRLKMWGIYVIQQEELAKLSESVVQVTHKRPAKKFVFDLNTSHSLTPSTQTNKSVSNHLLARIDILSCLNAVCHRLVFQDLLRVLALFPVALPLVLQNLYDDQWKYVCLIPLLKNISVKWEMKPGEIVQNQLFADPFKMIVALRVGSAKFGSSGKSSILNQVMANKYMFSSLGGPGSDKGIPVTLHGSVELVVLLQETCSYALWKSVVKSHYSSTSNEVLMLVNVHGDVLELSQTLELIKKMASSFVVFFMPCTRSELQMRSMKIQEMLDETEDIVYVLVDPTPDCADQPTDIINTNQLTIDSTLKIFRSALADAIQIGCARTVMPFTNTSKIITMIPDVFTEESNLLLTYIRKLGCSKARSALQLQKVNPKYINAYPTLVTTTWQTEPILQSLIRNFYQILILPIELRLLAFAHLDHELSFLTANESLQIRAKLRKFQEQKRRSLNFEGGSTLSAEQKRITEQIRLTMDELNDMSLGMEHFYREFGRLFQAAQCSCNPKNIPIHSLPRWYAELLMHGQAIEILDGDIGDMCGSWLNSICHCICEIHPDLRIFTLSIIGLQSSGKSTLLNALFACRFAVSVGRCTRGLFMRLIFLDKSLAEELDIDAILVIDTEGLGATEKLNDPEAEQKDRLLATFAMSVSNLTLINVLGESVHDLTDILQIVIVTMARLEKADISTDILMVQHLSERDTSKTMKGVDEFCKALEEAVSLTDSKDMKIGVRNSKSLNKLKSRVKNGQLLKQFRPFKNGASANAPPSQEYHEDVVDLYRTILNSCKQVISPQKFHIWHELLQNYWDAVSTQDFSLRFKNIQEVHEFIDRGSAIAKVKLAVDGAFRVHREDCETKLRQKVNKLMKNTEMFLHWETEKENELKTMREALRCIPHSCESTCRKCSEAVDLKDKLFRDLVGKGCQEETESTVNIYIQRTRESVIKHLSQMAEAIRVKHGWSCEFDALIHSILMEKRRDEPNPSENEREKMVDEVWSRLRRIISQKLQVASAKRGIADEVNEEYRHVNTVFREFNRNMSIASFPELRVINAVEFTMGTKFVNKMKDVASVERQHATLDYRQVNFLKSKLDELPNLVLKKCEIEHFERGAVRMLKEDVNNILEEFEKKNIHSGKLLPEFKWKVHVYALLKFTEVMSLKEEEWDRNNNPYYILLHAKDTYRKKIDICLQHGFGFEAEGHIIGNFLIKAIRRRAQKHGDRAHIDNIRSISWLTNSENVRLLYFSKLARQVEKGDKAEALKHFINPKAVIEAWFKKEVDSFSTKLGEKKFMETIDAELETVIQEIRNQKSCKEIKEYVGRYLSQVEDMEYNPDVDLESGSVTDVDLLQTVILNKIDEDKELIKLGITIIVPSTHLEIRSLLGCTEHCYWCGSLCWGQARHGENMDSTKKHHACHQPLGLIGVTHKIEKHLECSSCDSLEDNNILYWSNCEEGMSWTEVMSHKDFVNWMFTPHNKSEFRDLMKWFFLNLHKDIAEFLGMKPALDKELSANGFFKLLSLDHILGTIKSRI